MGVYDTLISNLNYWIRPPAENWGILIFPLMHFREAQPTYERINAILAGAPNSIDIGGEIDITLTSGEIEELSEAQHTIKMFLDSIHYEIAELVDIPFAQALEPVMEEAYQLSPRDFRTRSNFLGIQRGSSLEDLIVATITDEDLRRDFAEKTRNLDEDVPSQNLLDILNEARFWAREFENASAIREIQEAFINDHAAQWDNLSGDERLALMNEYAIAVGRVMDKRGFWDWFRGNPIAREVRWFSQDPNDPNLPPGIILGYIHPVGDGIIYMHDAFAVGDLSIFDLNQALNTLTHEVRHQYHIQAVNDSKRFNSASVVSIWDLDNQGEDYWIRPIEIDARAFAALSTSFN